MSLWGARFDKESDARLNDFNSSIHVDQRMYKQDIQASLAHVQMLAKQAIISTQDRDDITDGLHGILCDIEQGSLQIDPRAEDIHMFIEQELTQRIGSAGKKVHTARSRNDQVAVDFRLYAMQECTHIQDQLYDFIEVLSEKASAHTHTIMCGYTHLQRAQPITFAHHLMAYVEMLFRDIERVQDAIKRCNVCPLGCGALATSTYPIDRSYTKELLGFDHVSLNSLDSVSDRDFAIEMANAISLIMMHLSRLSEEIVLWCSWEFKYMELDDAFATGSSIMPQKKNPDVCELVRGKSGRVFGNVQALLTMMKGLSLSYNKDMQEDKELLFDSFDTVSICLSTITPMLKSAQINKENMRKNAAKGFINATDCADYLTKKGMPFRDAYTCIGQLVKHAQAQDKVLETLSIEDYKKCSPLFEDDIYNAISLETCVRNRNVVGGPAPETVQAHIDLVQKKCKERAQ